MPDVQSLVFAVRESNGTVVPKSLVLGSYAEEGTQLLFVDRVAFSPRFPPLARASNSLDVFVPTIRLLAERLDTLHGDSIALGITITFGRRSSVEERGSHNP